MRNIVYNLNFDPEVFIIIIIILFVHKTGFIIVRRYASAVYAMALCLSVCPSVRHKSVYYHNG